MMIVIVQQRIALYTKTLFKNLDFKKIFSVTKIVM